MIRGETKMQTKTHNAETVEGDILTEEIVQQKARTAMYVENHTISQRCAAQTKENQLKTERYVMNTTNTRRHTMHKTQKSTQHTKKKKKKKKQKKKNKKKKKKTKKKKKKKNHKT